MAHYVHDEKNNRIEALSKEEIYTLLAEAIQEGELPSVDEDTAFVTMFKSIVDGKTYKMAFCTQAQYNQLEAQGLLVANAYYIITDDETYDDIITYIDNKETSLLENISTKVPINFNDGTIENNIISNENGVNVSIDDIDGDSTSTAIINTSGVTFSANATDTQSTLNVGQGTLSISTADDDNGVQINISSNDAVISRTVDGVSEEHSLFNRYQELPITAGSTSVDISSYGAGLYLVEVEWYVEGSYKRFTKLMTITNSGTVITGNERVYYAYEYIYYGAQVIMRIDGFFYMYMGITPTGTIGIPSATSDMKFISIKKILW